MDIFEITNLHVNDHFSYNEKKRKDKERRNPTIFANIFVLRKIMPPLNYIIRNYTLSCHKHYDIVIKHFFLITVYFVCFAVSYTQIR